MGVYSWNNMANLYQETSIDQTADLILHAGDHCCAHSPPKPPTPQLNTTDQHNAAGG